jgi:hypothetical protein
VLFRRRLDELDFDRQIAIHPVPDGPVEIAAVAGPLRTRRSGDMIVIRFTGGGHAVAISPQGLAWQWPGDADAPRRMMLYTATGSRSARGEARRLAQPQRRDALYKADLGAVPAG